MIFAPSVSTLCSCCGHNAVHVKPLHLLTGARLFSLSGSGEGCGKIIQRFPKKDWEGTAFPQGVEMVSTSLMPPITTSPTPTVFLSHVKHFFGLNSLVSSVKV